MTVEDPSTKCVWTALQFFHQYCLSVPSKNSVNSVKSVKTLAHDRFTEAAGAIACLPGSLPPSERK
jgi:ectoine hydroxylase-related dioxygenase (phytanoyl-CoA dioxygenase family)